LTACTAPYFRLFESTAITGSGSVTVRYNGYTIAPNRIYGSDGSSITAATDPCYGVVTQSNVNGIVASTTLVKVVSASSAKTNNACGMVIENEGASVAHFSLIEGTKTTTECDTNATTVIGDKTTAANGLGVAPGAGGYAINRTIHGNATNKDWCIQNDGTNSIRVYFGLVQQ
jgi:hypothetical protein